MRQTLTALVLVAATATMTGCGPLLRMIGDAAANAITQKTNDLGPVAARIYYTTNLFPKTFELLETDYGGDLWVEGNNALCVVLQKRQGIGMYEVDGGVGYQAGKGEPMVMPYFGKGAYWATLAKSDLAAKSVMLRTSSGQSAKFQIAPAKPITIKAINGKAPANATIDLSKDLVLDLAHPPGALGTPIKVSLIATAVGQRSMVDVAVAKAAPRVVIPKAAFRNLQVTASHEGAVNLERGRNLLLVERFDHQVVKSNTVGAVELIGRAWSWAPVNVVGDWRPNLALTHQGQMAAQAGAVAYRMHKPSAFYGPPLLPGKNIGLGSLRARGKMFEQTSSSSEHYSGNYVVTTTTTTTLAFPDLPDSYWQSMLSSLERGLNASLKRSSGISLQPVSRLASSPTYKALEEQSDISSGQNATYKSTVYVERTLKGSRHVFPASFVSMMGAVSSTFAADRPISRMLSESKLDGILTGTLDVQIATQKGTDKLVLVPRFTFSIYGPPNGYMIGPTGYVDGTIETADGVPFNSQVLEANPDELERVVRLPDLLAAFEKSLQELRAKEKAEGYDAIWSLR